MSQCEERDGGFTPASREWKSGNQFKWTVDAKASCCELRSLALINISSDVGGFENTVVGFYYEKGTNMKLTRLMRTAFAVARSRSVATQVEVEEPTKRESTRILNGILTLIIVGLLIAPIASPKVAGAAKPAPGPTAESVT